MSQEPQVRRSRFDMLRSAAGGKRRWLYIVPPVCTAGVLLSAWLVLGDALFSQGPLSPSHAMLSRDCQTCHPASVGTSRWPSLRRSNTDTNRACLRCHQRTIGHSSQTWTATHHERAVSDHTACARCHSEHRGRVLSQIDDEACVRCHRDLRTQQSDVQVSTQITDFSGSRSDSEAATYLHPEFRVLTDKRPDPGVLKFNHQRHLFAGSLPGPLGRVVSLQCQDCHRNQGSGPWRFGRESDSTQSATAAPREAHMQPIAYAQHCAGCHALTLSDQADLLLGNDSVARGEIPHATPAVIRSYLRSQLAAASLRPEASARALHTLEQRLYASQAPGSTGCRMCHELKWEGIDPDELPVIVPTALPTRFLPRARFSHARHEASALGGYGALNLPAEVGDCLVCHGRAVDSQRTSDVMLPSIDECRRCHSQARGQKASARGGVSDRCTTCHVYHVPPPQSQGPTPRSDDATEDTPPPSLVEAGRHEVRRGLSKSTPQWPLSAFFALPSQVWGLPDVKPGSERFAQEVFQRYGLFPADLPNDGLPLGLIRTERTWNGQPGLIVTCEFCHSSSLFGRIVIGQPNPFSDMEALWRDLDQVGDGPGPDPFYAKTPAGNTVVNGADHLGLLGLYYRNPDLSPNWTKAARWLLTTNRSDRPSEMKAEFDALAYIKTPPWYTYATRKSGSCGLYADGGQPKYGNFAAFTYLLTFRDSDGQDLASALAAWKRSAPAFLSSLPAPAYPFALRSELLPKGRALYEASCARCHGYYAPTSTSPAALSYPGRVYPLSEIQTDPKRAHFPPTFTARIQQILNETYTITDGYAAPPLTAIWSRAPYLHNGSVPTLLELLDPPSRRATYVLAADPNRTADFDTTRVGWRVEPPPVGASPSTVHRLYDAAFVDGLGNSGHLYGAELRPDDRMALIEFLKTL